MIISLSEIQERASGWKTYKRGVEYFSEGRVKQLKFHPDELAFEAAVEGRNLYEVMIHTDPRGRLEIADCSCPSFYSMAGYCKHIVAVLFQIREGRESQTHVVPLPRPDVSRPEPNREDQAIRDILGLFQPFLPEKNTDVPDPTLQVQYLLELTPSWDGRTDRWFSLRLKVGPKRLYVVKNIQEFLSAFDRREHLYFTKNFTYDPTVHHPDAKDADMLRFLSSLSKSEQLYRQLIRPWDPPEGRKERWLVIPPDRIDDLLRLLPGERFQLEHEGISYTELPLIENECPVSFSLDTEGEGFLLKPEAQPMEEGPLLLSEDGYCFDSGKIYKLNRMQRENLLPMYRRIRQVPGGKLFIPSKQMETFASTVLPALKKDGQLKVHHNVSDQIVQHPLRTDIHLDYKTDDENGERLTARITYIYGEITVDPLLDERHQRRSEVVLLRDTEKEQRVMAVFEEVGFKFNGQELYLNDEEGFHRFLHEKIPQLEKLAALYTTQAFRNILEDGRRPVPHIDVDPSTDWLEVRFELPEAGEQELENILQAMIEKKRYFRLQSGAFVSLEHPGMEPLRSLLDEGGHRSLVIEGDSLKLPAARALQLGEMLDHPSTEVKIGKRFRRLIRNIKDPENLEFSPPPTLTPILRDYQRFGFQWMKTLTHYRFGGILADDMGLGKTLQALAVIVSELEDSRKEGSTDPALVVAPASLIYNWEKECARFAPELKTVVIAGTKAERQKRLQDLTGADLLITSYPLLRRDVELYEPHRFRILILDEAQAFKNQQSRTAQAVRRIPSRTRFALSGTPIENSVDELGSIFEVVLPGLFSGRQALRGLPPEEISRRVRPFILRRLKRDVLTELPEKIETMRLSELTTPQKELYLATLKQLQKETQQALQTDGFQKSRMKILAGLTRLRQICCHPSLYLENYTAGSGKFEEMIQLLDELLKNRRRVLIFSQFTSMLSLIREALQERNLPYHYLDGSTPAKERLEMADRFNSGEKDLFLIFLKAGGTGLNLTGADTVILYDLWWNPAVEQQAADRAHRIGQKNTVQVIKLIAKGTIEEKIHELQQKKQALFEQVIQPGEQLLTTLSEEDLRELLNMS